MEDSSPLFWQPGKRGYYAPRVGKTTPERINAYRNVGRYVSCYGSFTVSESECAGKKW